MTSSASSTVSFCSISTSSGELSKTSLERQGQLDHQALLDRQVLRDQLAPLAPLAQQGQLELRVLLELRVQREQLALPEQRVRLEPREAPMGT